MKQKMTQLQGEIDKSTIMIRVQNHSLNIW